MKCEEYQSDVCTSSRFTTLISQGNAVIFSTCSGQFQNNLLRPCCVTDADIIFSSCGFFFFFFSPNLSRCRLDVYHTSTQRGLSANLECMSEMCCTWLTENTRNKKSSNNRHLCTIAQLCPAISLQLRHVSTIEKKLVKQHSLLHMSPKYGELWPTKG